MLRVPRVASSQIQPVPIDGQEQFYDDLRGFFLSTGQKVGSFPHFNGRPLQLFQLYNAVLAYGGWLRVGQQDGWEDVAHKLGAPKPCANAGHALKSLYYQYLLKYECTKFNRAPVEDIYEDDDAFKRFALNGPGFGRIPDYLRESCGLSNDLKEEDVFERLQLSLASGLPNEVDFAINALLVRSADVHRPYLLTENSILLMETLLSTVGIFAEHAGHFVGSYNSFLGDSDKDFIRYWKETIDDQELWRLFEVDSACEQPLTSDTAASNLFAELASLDSNEIRVTQIATIFLNLSLDDKNAVLLAGNSVCLKFSSLCANSTRNAVFELGLNLMAQLSVKIDLPSREMWIQTVLIKTVNRCIRSPDRLRHVLGLSLVGSMCEIDSRQTCLREVLDEYHCTTLSQNLCVPDTPVVIFSLEVMYKLSGLGGEQATLIAENSANLDFLVRLLSVSSELIEGAVAVDYLPGGDLVPSSIPSTSSSPVAVRRSQNVPNSVPALPIVSQQESEETVKWFRQVFDEDESYAMSASDVYKDYAAFCVAGKKFAPALQSFTHCYQLAFPKVRSANYNLGGKVELCLAGIKRRNPIYVTEVVPLPNNVIEQRAEQHTLPPSVNGHTPHPPAAISPLASLQHQDSADVVMSNETNHEENARGPAKRQKKTSESSLIRSLLATKINRKQSTGSNDGLLNHTTSNSSHSFDEWRTPTDPARSDLTQLSDGIFSDMESNDSLLMTPPAQKFPRSRSTSITSDVVAAQKKKPPAKRKKKEPAKTDLLVNGFNGLSNGDSHGPFDDSSSSTAPLVVPYVLPEPKPTKKARGRKPKVNGAVAESGPIVEPVNGLSQSVEGKPAPKKPRRPNRKAKAVADLVLTDTNGLSNGHLDAAAGIPPPLEVPVKPKRKPSKRKPKKKPVPPDDAPTGNIAQENPDDVAIVFICEWEGCQRTFGQSAPLLFKHNYYDHVPTAVEGVCKWPNCTGIKRQALSLITHLNETHCTPNELLRQAIRRQELRRNIPPSVPATAPPPPPVAYTEHTALHSIQARYGSAVASDFATETESSSTRTLRLTAALVLRNISHFSHVGRIKLYKYEHILTISAMQQSEASHIVGECLYYLAVHKRDNVQQ